MPESFVEQINRGIELGNLKAENIRLSRLIVNYRETIKSLETENIQLAEINNSLEVENAKLRKQLADKDKTLATVHERFDALQRHSSMLSSRCVVLEDERMKTVQRESVVVKLSAPKNVSFRFVPEPGK